MRYPFINLSHVNAPYINDIERALTEVARSGWFLHGPQVEAFEKELAASCGSKATVAVSNGLDAIRLIFRAYIELGRLHEGDEVLVPANTFIASILPLTELKLRPVLVEPDPATHNLDWRRALTMITPRTKALLAVHLYGTPCWDYATATAMREKGILIVEDNAQAIGASAATPGFNGNTLTGNLGDAAAFSFYPTKNIGAMGDAGAVASSDNELLQKVATLANYGSDRRYHNIHAGWNCRMDEFHAATLRIKLRHLHEISAQRQHTAAIYDKTLNNPLIIKPAIFDGMRQVWHQYVVRTADRDKFMGYLASHEIGCDIHYPTPPHLQPCYKGILTGDLPITERLAGEVLSLPIASTPDNDIEEICHIINNYS